MDRQSRHGRRLGLLPFQVPSYPTAQEAASHVRFLSNDCGSIRLSLKTCFFLRWQSDAYVGEQQFNDDVACISGTGKARNAATVSSRLRRHDSEATPCTSTESRSTVCFPCSSLANLSVLSSLQVCSSESIACFRAFRW